jgi:hypothetical protein
MEYTINDVDELLEQAHKLLYVNPSWANRKKGTVLLGMAAIMVAHVSFLSESGLTPDRKASLVVIFWLAPYAVLANGVHAKRSQEALSGAKGNVTGYLKLLMICADLALMPLCDKVKGLKGIEAKAEQGKAMLEEFESKREEIVRILLEGTYGIVRIPPKNKKN